MKILIVGAGAIGGYFGGRLLEKEEDVTFLVREGKKEKLQQTGLNIHSKHGDLQFSPKLITKNEQSRPFDVVLISTKSYQLANAIEDVQPFVGPETMILPLLNGIAHLQSLTEAFGEENVLGGLCFVESTLAEDGTIVQTSPVHQLIYGERTGEKTERIGKLESAFTGTKAEFIKSDHINQEMWHKYLFITAMSGITSMMETSIGPIRDLETGQRTIQAFLEELTAIMEKMDAPIKPGIAETQLKRINSMGAEMKSSMQRDIEKMQPTEAEHLQGYLLVRAKEMKVAAPVLEIIYTKLKLYEQKINTDLQSE
ncbi:2-dehydropantoate 2-reductase [Planococcus antarcticus DSM 14505]|uniref:2-dehydropantoate 2-reductase n=1 Tax=Planococcus antarcticus DSM 14505 TaxID=1185653 RepID=A0A1C7DC48_9BACL|nr:ketopantoate reductase family protein [Planococcus antarcticus]ANU09024.1 2-dehydropantoate 2-reductase [Planococcus antarcticus DSM 14505]EIM07273.1 2-dehydropantoate 2-reductase [Planococcus antarcticus DSM 14505]